MKEKSKAGRKPIAGRKLTYAEVKQRQRMKAKCLRDAMHRAGYYQAAVYVHPKQIEAVSYIGKRLGGEGVSLDDPTKLSEHIFRALKVYIKEQTKVIPLTDGEPLAKLIESGNLPESTLHEAAQLEALTKFKEWSDANIKELQEK